MFRESFLFEMTTHFDFKLLNYLSFYVGIEGHPDETFQDELGDLADFDLTFARHGEVGDHGGGF